jgi:hypothetical protein
VDKIIHCHVSDPSRQTLFFKNKKTDKACAYFVTCSNSENCSLFKEKRCSARRTFASYCPYGRQYIQHGFSRMAKGFRKWIDDVKSANKDVGTLDAPQDKFAYVGDYVYLPYAHMDMNTKIPFLAHGGFMKWAKDFIPKSAWTIDTIIHIVEFRPQAFFGGEISDYQKKEIPLFLQHLEEMESDMYQALLAKRPDFIQKYNLTNKNYVGRKAYLWTLTPSTVKLRTEWNWDGQRLSTILSDIVSWDDKIKTTSFNCSMVPDKDVVVKITDNKQVHKGTKFLD